MSGDEPSITWPALLAHWMRLAQASAALPATAEGDRFRAAVPGIIALHALTCALAEIERVTSADRAAAVDRAAYLIRLHGASVRGMFAAGESAEIDELLLEAEQSLGRARFKVRDQA